MADQVSIVDGVEVVGDQVFVAKGIYLQGKEAAKDEPCRIAVAAGIPVCVRRKTPTGFRHHRYRIVRIMSDPRSGLAPSSWQYGGMLGPAPPVLMFRTDGVPFTPVDFEVLDDFEMAMLDDGPRSVTRESWTRWCPSYRPRYGVWNTHAFDACPIMFQTVFSAGKEVRVKGLQNAAELNGVTGVVAGGSHYTRDRVGVHLPEPHGLKALKPANIELVQ